MPILLRKAYEIDDFLHKAAIALYGREGTFFNPHEYHGYGWQDPLPGDDKRLVRRTLELPWDETYGKRIVVLRNRLHISQNGSEDMRGFPWQGRDIKLEAVRGDRMWAHAIQGFHFHVTEGNTWAEMDVVHQVALAANELWDHV